MGDDQLWLQNTKHYSFSLSDIELMDHFPPGPFPQSPFEFATDHRRNSISPQIQLHNFTTPPAPAPTPFAGPDISIQTDRPKRKAIAAPEISPANSSPDNSIRIPKTKKRLRKGKKARTDEDDDEDEKQSDVVHVRARRGQATDRHSLAERVRRKKINERLRCLQDIVPGCYKTMGMAVMLDEIINYVQSLQTQVEFLSTRLTTASSFHDFNPNRNAFDTTQRANTFEALGFENIAIEGGFTFGYDPQLPRNT